MTTDLSKFKETYTYHAGPQWKVVSWYLINNWIFNSAVPWPSSFKIGLLRLFGASVGNNVVIKPKVRIKHAWRISIGDNSWLGEGTWIENLETVELGKNVCISQNAMLLTGNHDYTTSDFRYKLGKIRLEDGVWIGAFSVVCPGVVCQSHSVLTVNSVASKNMEAWTIYSGNPAIIVRNRKMVD
ncbi:MAG: acyl transferase [Daejeonella sp.]|nr:acyl transferase [Daejeonella sp.]